MSTSLNVVKAAAVSCDSFSLSAIFNRIRVIFTLRSVLAPGTRPGSSSSASNDFVALEVLGSGDGAGSATDFATGVTGFEAVGLPGFDGGGGDGAAAGGFFK